MKRTGIVKDVKYMDHDMGPYHPESPQRLEVIYDMLAQADMRDIFQDVPVREAEREDLLLIRRRSLCGRLQTARIADSLPSIDVPPNCRDLR